MVALHRVYFTSKFHHMARRSCDGTSGPLCGTGRATRWLPAQVSKYVHERAARGRSLPVHSSTRYRVMYIVLEPLLGLGDQREKNLVSRTIRPCTWRLALSWVHPPSSLVVL